MARFDGESPRAKRRKLDSHALPDRSVAITSHKQLRDLLVFHQNPNEAKQGINKFKEFLLSIAHVENDNDKSIKFNLLKAFCESQISRGGEGEEAVCFPDLIQTWSFADSNNNESLLTIVPSVLAIFLKTVSHQLEFRDFGLALCKFLIQKDQLRLFNRGLTAHKAKEHLISPCLRLLTEIVSFDGGAIAQQLYSKRHITFKRIDIFLTPNKSQLEDASDDAQRSTLRRNALRYVLANLRFQHGAAKSEILEQQKVVKAFFEFMRKDPRELVLDIIKAVDRDVIQDSSLSRSTKTKFFGRWNLERLVTLYGYDRESEEPSQGGVSVANEVHKILMTVCTNSAHGVLLPETGWYPLGSDPDSLPIVDPHCIDLGLDSPIYADKYRKYRETVPVRNGILSYLIQVLRPDVDSLQIELLVAIFAAAPELVADFFTKKTMFVSDPKPTPSWMAESAFLYSTIELPVPANFGWKEWELPVMPPPSMIVIESILPRPLTPKILARCLNQNAEIITLFAVRILTIALNKLRDVRKILRSEQGPFKSLWKEASDKLDNEFYCRCPGMKDVILLYRRTAKEDLKQQEAVAELMACLFEVVPLVAIEESFDVSLVLVDILKRLETPDLGKDDSESLRNQLRNMLKIARMSVSMRWWQKPASMPYTAFTSTLKVLAEGLDDDASKEIHALLKTVLVDSFVLRNSQASFSSLVSSLKPSGPEDLHSQLAFLDNCICRGEKKPVHYVDLVEALHEGSYGSVSQLVAIIVEQWPFVTKGGNSATETAVGAWIARLLGHLKQAGEDTKALKAARDKLCETTGDKKTRSLLKKSLKVSVDIQHDGVEESAQKTATASSSKIQEVDLNAMFGPLPAESDTHNELHKWEKEELDVAIEQGSVTQLMLGLCSQYEEVRRQAYANISRFMAKLKESKYPEWRAIYLLSGELLETVNQHFDLSAPVPWIVGECAASCLSVLINPRNKVYGKVNKFLQKAPVWTPEKIPSYWIDKILLHPPEVDGGLLDERMFLFNLLINGLRTKADVEIYRRSNVWERVLVLYSVVTKWPAKRLVQHLLYRCTQAGGSTTLITRAAGISWIGAEACHASTKEAMILAAIARELYDTCDRERIDRWSHGAMGRCVENIQDLARR